MSQDTIASPKADLDELIARLGQSKVAQHILDSLSESKLSAQAKKELRPALRQIMTAPYKRPADAGPMSFDDVVAVGQDYISAAVTKVRLRTLLAAAVVKLSAG